MTGCKRCRRLIHDPSVAHCPQCGEPLHASEIVLKTDVVLISNAMQTEERPMPPMALEHLEPDTAFDVRVPTADNRSAARPPDPHLGAGPRPPQHVLPLPVVRERHLEAPREIHLVVLLSRAIVSEYRFHSGIISFGRDPRQDVVLDNPSVSRLHCKIRFLDDGERAVLEDLGTPNGTIVNRRPIRQAELAPGDEIGIGKFVVLFRPAAQQLALLEARERAPRTDQVDPAETCFLSISEVHRVQRDQSEEHAAHIKVLGPGGRPGRRISLIRATTVLGRSIDADVPLSGWFISDRHALIVKRARGYRLIHNAGFRPVWLNGKPVRECSLSNRDEIRIGSNTFSFYASI